MLQRVGPSRYRADERETVTVVAVAQNNNGVESASFRYGPDILATRDVQGHPGCDFVVDRGAKMFGTSVLFDIGTTTAQYDLFEEDDNGNLVDLRFAIPQPFGPVGQFQVDGIPVAAVAAARAKGLRRTAAPREKGQPGTTGKKKSTKKAAKKARVKTRAAKRVTKKRAATKRTKARAARSAARRRPATRTRARRTSKRRKHR
jgi:hypothetical protein